MNILVTGAAGFIGSHVCEHFLSDRNCVIGIDNFDPFYAREIKELNIKELKDNSSFSFFEIDIRDRITLGKLFSNYNFDFVIHLAAKAGVRPSIDSIADYYDVNVNGTVILLEIMKNYNVKKMIFASSSSVYGNNTKVPFSESDFVDYPISPYAATKKSGELICHVYSHLYGFDITCLRFFTVFGPRQRPDLAIYKFTQSIDMGLNIPFYGDGSTARDYTYIEDILSGIRCAFDNIKGYQIFNLGEGRVITLKKMVQTIEATLGKKAVLNLIALQPGDVKITYADISKARLEIGYTPKYNFNKGINEFINWYYQNKRVLNI